MMSMDVPLVVWWHDAVGHHAAAPNPAPYFCIGVTGEVASQENLARKLLVLKENIDDYAPRKYILENLSLSVTAIDYLKMFCGLPTRWPRNGKCQERIR